MTLEGTQTNPDLLHAIFDTIDEGIHVVDLNGYTIYYNKVAAKLDGVDANEVIHKHVLDVFPSLTEETSTLLQVIKHGSPIYYQKQQFSNVRGMLIDTVNTTMPIYQQNKMVGAVEISKNLSAIKQLSEKLVELQEKVNKKDSFLKKKHATSSATFHFENIITNNDTLNRLKQIAAKASKTTSPILIYGETGTGKELFVQSIHNASIRQNGPFIAQNCAAIPASLLESILFGTTKGSFTGATERPGLFELAHNGTLFLDEINSMPIDLQAKLLRVIEDGIVRRIGGTKGIQCNVRIITAMNEHPSHCIKADKLRQDLFYRISVVTLNIPPLRERKEDLTILSKYFLSKYNERFGKAVTIIDNNVYSFFQQYNWPGNVRELEHAIESAMNVVDGDTITEDHLPVHLNYSSHSTKSQPISFRTEVEKFEKSLIKKALQQNNQNILQTAKTLNIPRQTLQYKMKKYNITK
ncbi:sigma-54-dependent Fis family transcriptional regulator [Alkalihalophilus pseudofirmus]|uniref:sigma-54 interaction domain-containing protein n=1 Tax=Alkalihalobacterium alkalinitrilicum TaxID=427920 RepID=UPI00094BFED5|nr:sigma 54-interacting transcriptional regulator [Alkalihalobacterium alkalinitrilicum]OLO40403.1 sigma-54-dependent Fis family transcriptional regulator [Alkalihalophilus pseudofirmus]